MVLYDMIVRCMVWKDYVWTRHPIITRDFQVSLPFFPEPSPLSSNDNNSRKTKVFTWPFLFPYNSQYILMLVVTGDGSDNDNDDDDVGDDGSDVGVGSDDDDDDNCAFLSFSLWNSGPGRNVVVFDCSIHSSSSNVYRGICSSISICI